MRKLKLYGFFQVVLAIVCLPKTDSVPFLMPLLFYLLVDGSIGALTGDGGVLLT